MYNDVIIWHANEIELNIAFPLACPISSELGNILLSFDYLDHSFIHSFIHKSCCIVKIVCFELT